MGVRIEGELHPDWQSRQLHKAQEMALASRFCSGYLSPHWSKSVVKCELMTTQSGNPSYKAT